MSEFTEVKTENLEGVTLDWVMAGIEGLGQTIRSRYVCDPSGGVVGSELYLSGCTLSTDWSQCGPLIERYKVDLSNFDESAEDFVDPEPWIAKIGRKHVGIGPTPLVAACRAIVASVLGDTVSVPKELV